MNNPSFDGIVHFCDQGVLWGSRGPVIFQSENGGLSWTRVLELPIKNSLWLKSRFKLARRLFRMMVYHLQIVGTSRLCVLGFGSFFTFDLQDNGRLLGFGPLLGKRPLVFCQTTDGRLLYGEYRGNPGRTAVQIRGSRDGGINWYSACTIEGVRHIHGVFEDPYRGDLWITTGDEDHESAVWKCSPDFSDRKKIIGGSQQSRAISLEFSEGYIYFGSDTPLQKNRLYRFERGTNLVEEIHEVNGSVFHSCNVGGTMFFSTAVEPSEINNSDDASVYQIDAGVSCKKIRSWPKDPWPKRLFQYGQVFLTGDETRNGIWVSPLATRGDQKSEFIRI